MYATVSTKDVKDLRVERLHILEMEHARCLLLLEEDPKDVKVSESLADVQRRIAVHHAVLTGDAAPTSEDTDGT